MSDDIRITWTDNATGEDGYRVYRSRDGGSSWTQASGDLAPDTTQFDDTGLLDGEEYVHKVEVFTTDATAESGATSPVTTDLPDASGLQFDASVEDELTAQWDDVIDYGNYDIEARESNEGQAWGATYSNTVGESSTSDVIPNLEDGEQYDVRIRTRTEHVTGSWLALSEITLLPAPTGLSATTQGQMADSNAIPLNWTDNSDHGDEVYRAYYSDDGGNSFTEASGSPYGADAQSATLSGLAYSTTYTVKVRVETEHTHADSGTVTATTSWEQDDTLWLGWERTDGSRFDTDRVIEAATSYEHTAMHGGNPVVPSSEVARADVFSEIVVAFGSTVLLRGEIEAVNLDEPSPGEATIALRGPGLALTRAGPSSDPSYANTPYHSAISDYCNNQAGSNISATVHTPPTTLKSDDVEVTDPGFNGGDLYTPADDEPIAADATSIRPLITAYTGVEDDFGGLYTVVSSNNEFSGEYYISGEAADLDPADDITFAFTPEYDIPADRVRIRVHTETSTLSGSGTPTATLNSNDLGNWVLSEGWDSPPSQYSGGDLQAGTSYTFSWAPNDNWSGGARIDAITIYDANHPPQTFGSVSDGDLNGEIAGPSRFPQDHQIQLSTFSRPWAVIEGRIDSTWTDTSNGQQISLSPNGGQDWISFTNQADATADFDAQSYYGDILQPRVTLSAFGTYDGWLTQRGQRQEITAFDVFVTTNDLPVIGADGVTLQDSDFENLRTLHPGGLRFVIDPTVSDPVTIESFQRDDSAVEKTLNTRVLDIPQLNRDVTGYGNEVTIKYRETDGGDLKDFTMRDSDEVNRVGEVIPRPPVFSSVSTADGARTDARNRLSEAISRDELGGDIQTVADVILPGYSYTGINDWPSGSYSLERTSFREGRDTAEAQLQFTADDDITQTVIDTAKQQRELEKTG